MAHGRQCTEVFAVARSAPGSCNDVAVPADGIPEGDPATSIGARGGLAGNATWMILGQGIAKVASFGLVIIVTRGLDEVAYGQFSFAVSFVPLFLIVGSWGLDTALLREVARDPRNLSPLLSSGLVIRVGIGLVALTASVAIGAFIVDGRTAFQTLVILGVALLLDEVTTLLGSVFKAFERMAFYSLALVTNRVVTTVLALVAVASGGDIVVVSGTYLLGSAGALLFATLALRRRFPPVRLRDANRATLLELGQHGAPLGLAAALNMALFRVDAALLQVIDGAAAVGIYGIAYRFLDSFLFVAFALGVVAMPRIARSQWSPEAANGFNGALAAMLAFYVPLAVGGSFLGRWAVVLLFSDQYEVAAEAVGWLTGAGLFYAIAYICRLSLVALGHRREIVVVAAATLTINVCANLWAIPQHGFRGAAAVTFFSEVLEAAALAALLARSVERFRLQRLVAAPLIGGAAMAGALAASAWDASGGVALGVGVYVVVTALSAAALAQAEARELINRVLRRS